MDNAETVTLHPVKIQKLFPDFFCSFRFQENQGLREENVCAFVIRHSSFVPGISPCNALNVRSREKSKYFQFTHTGFGVFELHLPDNFILMHLRSKTSDLASAGSNEKSIRVNSNILNQRDFFTQFNMTSGMKKNYKFLLAALVAMTLAQFVNAQVDVSGAHASSNGSYTTIREAFAAINLQDQTGFNILVGISDNTTETATATLNQGAWATLTVYPTASGKTISGTMDWPLIKLNGADNVTIDGSYNGITQSLTFSNNKLGTSNNTIALSNSANNNTIKNCRIYSKYRCITTTDADNTLIEGNEIFGDALGNSIYEKMGIYLYRNTTNAKIRRNSIHDFYCTNVNLLGLSYGMMCYSGYTTTSETEISNNVIYAIKGFGSKATTNPPLSGIIIYSGGNIKIFVTIHPLFF
jgi:parallel beta-helix repeat protein